MKLRNAVLLAAVCALALPTFAAHPQKPGKWEMTTEIDMPGMPMKMQPMTHTMCVTKEDLEKNPEGTVPRPRSRNGSDSSCKVSDYKTDANTVSWKITCEGQNPVNGEGKITYTADSFKGAMTMKIGDREMTAKYSGKFLGAECTKDEKK